MAGALDMFRKKGGGGEADQVKIKITFLEMFCFCQILSTLLKMQEVDIVYY